MHPLKNSIHMINRLCFNPSYFRSARKAKTDLYQILGVPKTADSKELKVAYYKLAQEYHPDKNPSPEAKEHFTVINNAYEILSDSSKRQMYDQTGQTGEGNAAEYNNHHGEGQGANYEDIFSQFQGGRGNQKMGGFDDIFSDLFGGGFQQRRSPNQYDNSPISMNMVLSFEESVKGTTKTIEYDRKCLCSACNGKRSRPGTEPQKCRTCSGSGTQTFKQGMFIMKSACQSCDGEGSKIKHFCGTCNGKGFEKKRIKQDVQIPRGINDGMTIKLTSKGNFKGDLFLKVQVRKNPNFKRLGVNVQSELKISVLDAILGTDLPIQTIEGTTTNLAIPRGIQSGQTVTLKGEGFHLVNSNSKGDQIVVVTVQTPKKLTPEEQELYFKLKSLNI